MNIFWSGKIRNLYFYLFFHITNTLRFSHLFYYFYFFLKNPKNPRGWRPWYWNQISPALHEIQTNCLHNSSQHNQIKPIYIIFTKKHKDFIIIRSKSLISWGYLFMKYIYWQSLWIHKNWYIMLNINQIINFENHNLSIAITF